MRLAHRPPCPRPGKGCRHDAASRTQRRAAPGPRARRSTALVCRRRGAARSARAATGAGRRRQRPLPCGRPLCLAFRARQAGHGPAVHRFAAARLAAGARPLSRPRLRPGGAGGLAAGGRRASRRRSMAGRLGAAAACAKPARTRADAARRRARPARLRRRAARAGGAGRHLPGRVRAGRRDHHLRRAALLPARGARRRAAPHARGLGRRRPAVGARGRCRGRLAL